MSEDTPRPQQQTPTHPDHFDELFGPRPNCQSQAFRQLMCEYAGLTAPITTQEIEDIGIAHFTGWMYDPYALAMQAGPSEDFFESVKKHGDGVEPKLVAQSGCSYSPYHDGQRNVAFILIQDASCTIVRGISRETLLRGCIGDGIWLLPLNQGLVEED